MFNSTREFEACVLVRGKPVTEVVHNGQTFIEGRRKSTYELRFTNRTHQQILVVPSVDGLSVIDGQPAGKDSPGFVVSPYGSVDVPGWAVNNREAAEFVFHAQDAHYADEQTYVEEMGEDPQNQGVIGFMVFRPLPVPRTVFPYTGVRRFGSPSVGDPSWGRHTTTNVVYDSHTLENGINTGIIGAHSVSCSTGGMDSLGNQPSNAVDPDVEKALGTGFGEAVEFETQSVEFQREAEPCAVFAFYYDTLKNLRRAGVPVEHFRRHHTESASYAPNPFPTSPEVTGYAPTPAGWTGKKYSRRGRRKTR